MRIPDAMNGSTDNKARGEKDFAELQNLIVGDERIRLDRIEQRLRDPQRRASDLSEVLPEAIQLRGGRDVKLRRSLEPIFEQTFKSSVRRNPDVITETLYPVIGVAIRKAVNAALASMVETLNLTLDHSFSPQALKWRLEALRSGKSFGEIMLAHSVHYAMEQVFLIHRQTGVLLAHVAISEAVVRDADLVSGMLTAIQDFVRDSFSSSGNEGIEDAKVGDFTIWVQQGPLAIIAGVIRGVPPSELKVVFQRALESIHRDFSNELHSFHGDTEPFAAAEPILGTCLLGRSTAESRPTRSRALAIGVGLLCVALGLWAFLGLREIYRANEYLGILKKEPGIAITNTEWTAGRLALYGLRDPLSRDPLKLTAGTGIDPSKVDLHLEAYQSLDLAFRAQRKLNAEKDEIENTLLRFDTGSAVLRPASEDRLEDLVRHLKALFAVAREAKQNAQIEVVGHTDSTGTDDINDVLAVNRAATVVAEMRDLGISDSQFVQRGVGDKQPVRIGTGERDQAYNRSVSFRVIIGQ